MKPTPSEGADDSAENQGFVASFLAKLLNNIQVTVKNVHIRYEDDISVPDVRLQVPIRKATTLISLASTRSLWVSRCLAFPRFRWTKTGSLRS
jgi:hypothetical protein